MTSDEERAYLEGQRALLRRQLAEIIRELGYDSPEAANRWISEREAAVSMLRQICAEHGDNDWSNDLHLADVLEKHLWHNLENNRS